MHHYLGEKTETSNEHFKISQPLGIPSILVDFISHILYLQIKSLNDIHSVYFKQFLSPQSDKV